MFSVSTFTGQERTENVPRHPSPQKVVTPPKKKKKKRRRKDYRPVAPSRIFMKYLERFVIRELYDDVKNVLDPFHFTYKDKRGTGDAVNTLVHLVLKHLD